MTVCGFCESGLFGVKWLLLRDSSCLLRSFHVDFNSEASPKNSRKRSFERNSKKESTKLFKYLLKVRYDPSIGNFERDAEKNFLNLCCDERTDKNQ